MNEGRSRLVAGTERLGNRLGRAASVGRVLARVLPVDTNPVPPSWTHVTKVDPEAERRLPLLYPRYLRHTDAVAVGGSTAVTQANTEATFSLLSVVAPPVFHEPSDPTHVTTRTRDDAAFVAVPQVLNGDTDAIVGHLGAGIERVRSSLAPALLDERLPNWTPRVVRDLLADAVTSWLLETAVFEAYLVQNPDSAVAREAGVGPDDVLAPGEAARRAMVADRYLRSPVVYVEYSGRFGGADAEAVLRAVRSVVSRARVWYGGGLRTREATRAVVDAGADAVVVGNVFHDIANEEAALFERALTTDALAVDSARATVAEWLTTAVDVDETAAHAYLATVPSVDDPTDAARRLLVDTLTVWLRFRALSDRPSDAALTRALRDVTGTDRTDAATSDWARVAHAAVVGTDDTSSLSPAGVG